MLFARVVPAPIPGPGMEGVWGYLLSATEAKLKGVLAGVAF